MTSRDVRKAMRCFYRFVVNTSSTYCPRLNEPTDIRPAMPHDIRLGRQMPLA
jgi:hypothetical protein